MIFGEDYLKLLGQVSNFRKEVTGVSIIDAYFGPKNLSPQKAETPSVPEKLLTNLDPLIGKAKEIDDELRRIAITSDIESLKVVVRWLFGRKHSLHKFGRRNIWHNPTQIRVERNPSSTTRSRRCKLCSSRL